MRSIEIIGWMMIVFGVLLFYADKFGKEKKSLDDLSFKHAAIMGLFQAFALIPGVSRSGITITGFRIFGYNKSDAIKGLPELPEIMDKANKALSYFASGQIPQNSNSYTALNTDF